ncbi:Signal transduction histidine kinase [Belnapia rosea]|uniref:histidine kinase n=1 Tax=Belnapia rosea TaxID=938405 RepID=A0A1G6NS91_9PROT|nr:Signal transduction histidine kinase [Belnapia rosea]
MLCVCSEVTAQVLVERRLELQRDLAAQANATQSTEATCRTIAAAIAQHSWDIPFALIYLRAAEPWTLSLAAAVGVEAGGPAAPSRVRLDGPDAAWPWPLAEAATGAIAVVEATARIGALRGGPFGHAVATAIALPLSGAGGAEPLGVLVCGTNPSRALDSGYRAFYELLAGQVSAAIRNAEAYAEERRRAHALAELDRAKTQFFSNVSHEFRTPLTLLLGPVEDLLARPGLAPALREELAMVRRNALRLLRLVNALLDFARAEAGRAEASFEPVELGAATVELAGAFRSTIERAGLRFVVDCPPLREPAYVDPDLWEKIVLNLLSNAFKHTFKGRIAVALREDQDGMIRLSVTDTGVGIPGDQVGRVFDRFQRIEGARARTHEGSGIGLALVQELVSLHGGRISVESEPGRGSVFTVAIPAGQAHLPADRIGVPRRLQSTALGAEPFVAEAMRWSAGPAAAASSDAPKVVPIRPGLTEPPAAVATRPRIPLADDNADMRAYVERLLAADYDTVAVADGEAALGGPGPARTRPGLRPVARGFCHARHERGRAGGPRRRPPAGPPGAAGDRLCGAQGPAGLRRCRAAQALWPERATGRSPSVHHPRARESRRGRMRRRRPPAAAAWVRRNCRGRCSPLVAGRLPRQRWHHQRRVVPHPQPADMAADPVGEEAPRQAEREGEDRRQSRPSTNRVRCRDRRAGSRRALHPPPARRSAAPRPAYVHPSPPGGSLSVRPMR